MTQPSEPRELSPVQMFWDHSSVPGFKDFSPNPVSSDAEVEEVESVITPAPKDESAPESADSEAFQQTNPPSGSETPVPTAPVTPALPLPTELLEAAVKESGKDSESSEEEPQTQQTTSPDPETSSQDFSLPTSPGVTLPPAVIKPPTSD